MARGVKKLTGISCADYVDGLNTVDRAVDVGKRYLGRDREHPKNGWKQCIECRDMMLHNGTRRPAVKAINSAVGSRISGLFPYLQYDGTDLLVMAAGGKVYTVDKSAGTATERYDFGNAVDTWAVPYLNKLWICQEGVGLAKLENTTAYQVGIDAPSGVSVAAKAGGSMTLGDWEVYVGYARRVSGTNVLYSQGQSIGTVTLSGSNQTLEVTSFANSSDGQVGNKIVWASGPNDSGTVYLYYQTNDNTTTAFDVTDETGKVSTLTYGVQASLNETPGLAEGVCVHDKRLWYWIDNYLYYSLQSGNVYDLERVHSTAQAYEFPYNIEFAFPLGADLYVSTPGGILRLPNGDVTARFVHVTKRVHEYYPRKYARTVDYWSDMVIGLTPDGIRLFNGQKMYAHDITGDIKPDIDRLYSGYSANNKPCGVVHRRGSRTEYRLGYLDPNAGSGVNNRQLVLNLDKLGLIDNAIARAPWERWSVGATHMCVDNSGVWFAAQGHATASTIFKERTDRMLDEGVYIANDNKDDVLESSGKVPALLLRSGYFLPSLSAYCTWRQIRAMAQFLKDWYVRVQRIDNDANDSTQTISPDAGGYFQLDVSRLGTGILSSNAPTPKKQGLPRSLKGYAVYIEVTQTLEDRDFELLDLALYYTAKQSRYS